MSKVAKNIRTRIKELEEKENGNDNVDIKNFEKICVPLRMMLSYAVGKNM